MKKLIRILALSFALLTAVVFSSLAKPQEAVQLEEVTLTCSQHTVDYTLNLGIVSITYHVLWTICDNGTEYWDLI
jgi:hypothetical protein